MSRMVAGVVCLAALMPGRVIAEPDPGKAVFDQWCTHCHAPGIGHPGTQRLGWDRGADKAVLEKRDDLTADYVKHVVRRGLLEMPAFRITEISRPELDALAGYLSRAKK